MNKKQFGSFLCFAILSFSTISFAEEKNNTKFVEKPSQEQIIPETSFYRFVVPEKEGIIDKTGKIVLEANTGHILSRNKKLSENDIKSNYTREKKVLSNLFLTSNEKVDYYGSVIEVADDKNIRYGLKDSKGKIFLEPKYDSIGERFLYDFFDFKLNKKSGVINIDGKIILEPECQKVATTFPNEINNNVIDFKLNNKYGIIDKSGKIILKAEYDELGEIFENTNSNYFYVKKENKYYILDKRDFSIKRELDDIYFSKKTDFDPENNDYQKDQPSINEAVYKNTALVKENNLWGIINTNNEFTLKPYFEELVFFELPYYKAIENTNKKVGLVYSDESENVRIIENKNFQKIGYPNTFNTNDYEEYYNNKEYYNVIPFQKNDKWGFINEKNEIVIEPKWDYVCRYVDGFAYVAVKNDKKNPNKEKHNLKTLTLNKPNYENEERVFDADIYDWGIVDKSGKVIIKPEFDFIKRFSEGLAYAIKDNKAGFIDKNGNWAIKPEFTSNLDNKGFFKDELNYFKNGFAIVSKDNTLLLIDKLGAIRFRFLNNWNSNHPICILADPSLLSKNKKEKDKKEEDIDLNNIQNIEFLSVSGFYNGICIVLLKNGKYGAVNTDGKWVLKPEYDSIPIISNEEKSKSSLFQIKDKNNKTTFIDQNYNIVLAPNSYNSNTLINDVDIFYTKNNKARLIDKKGNFISNKTFDSIEKSSENTFNVQVGDLWGVIDKNADFIIEPKFKSIDKFEDNQAIFHLNSKVGICDKNGKILIPAEYDDIYIAFDLKNSWYRTDNVFLCDSGTYIDLSKEKIILKSRTKNLLLDNKLNILLDNIEKIESNFVKLNDKWYILDEKINKKPIIYQEIKEFDDKYFLARLNNKWGVIDSSGNTIIKPNFEELEISIKNELIKVKLNGKWGFINYKGEFIIKPQFDSINDFNDNIAKVKINNKYGYIDKTDKVMLKAEYDELDEMRVKESTNNSIDYDIKCYIVTIEGKKGLLNGNFKQLLETKYKAIQLFSFGGEYTNITIRNSERLKNKKEKSEPFFIVTLEDDKKGLFNFQKEKFILEPIFDSLSILNNELVKFTKNDKFGFANLSGDILLPETCENIKSEKYPFAMDSYIFPCKINDKYGYIDEKGNKLIDFKYDSANFFRKNEAIVEIGNKHFIIDKKGNVIE